ncbi:AAA family ATPase, partial [Oceanobacillus indicireducens]
IQAVMSNAELTMIQAEFFNVIVNIVNGTREHPAIYLGVSPRGSIALMKAAKAYAYIHDRDYVLPDDVKYLAPFVLRHRIILTSDAKFNGETGENIMESILRATHIPVRRESD